MINSIMMFGSVYFKRKAVIKTMLCILAFNFVLTVISLILGWIMHKGSFMLLGIEDPAYADTIVYVAMAIITVFFWVLSYFRLKETEA
jgi:NADH:ubiquinone oxidoreductase subunit 6 (subunit J)